MSQSDDIAHPPPISAGMIASFTSRIAARTPCQRETAPMRSVGGHRAFPFIDLARTQAAVRPEAGCGNRLRLHTRAQDLAKFKQWA